MGADRFRVDLPTGHSMTADEYANLMEFLATRFARMDARFDAIEARIDAMETRLTRSEVLWESMRDDIWRVAEGVQAVNERLDRFQAETRERFAALERGNDALQVRFDRFTVDFGTVQLDHPARIEALERQRRRRGPGG